MRHPDVPMARPLIGAEEEAAVARVLRSGWVMQGPEVAAFEAEFAAWVGASDAVAVSSGTAALHLGLLAAGVRPGDEVVTVSHSFVATANSVRHCGATPVFVDIEPGTFNIDPRAAAAAIGPQTRALLVVHQLGLPCDLPALAELARAHGLPLVEDAACAAGSEILWPGDDEWQRIGRPHGDLACFSFHPRKLITTGDGGMITVRDAAQAATLRAWRNHGAAHGQVGFNYRLTDLQAALGRVQLQRLPGLVAERQSLVARLRAALDDVVRFPDVPAWARSNWQSLCVRLPSAAAAAATLRRLEAAGVAARPGLINAHTLPQQGDGLRFPLPESERAAAECVLLPLPSNLRDDELERILSAVRGA